MSIQLNEDEIDAVFQRLRSILANKTCFDCGAKNPTWCSVTYGVFICIDCSSVHRSLGVHLTFVRSTQLDRNWTTLQLRHMQLGGNSNAMQFFIKHNCTAKDALKKYSSRAANLYRIRLEQMANDSLKTNNEVHLTDEDHHRQQSIEQSEMDFFAEEHDAFNKNDSNLGCSSSISKELTTIDAPFIEGTSIENEQCLDGDNNGPTVDFNQTATVDSTVRKSTLIVSDRKNVTKKAGLGVKKGGLGATKVKTNFAEVEKEAEMAEKLRLKTLEETQKAAVLTAKEQEEKAASVRFAYKDLREEQQRRDEEVQKMSDPKKASQIERLGMGFGSRGGVSHSAVNDMETIEQPQTNPNNNNSSNSNPLNTLNSLGKLRLSDLDFYDDNSTAILSSLLTMNRLSNGGSGSDFEHNEYTTTKTTPPDYYLTSTSSSAHDSSTIRKSQSHNDNNWVLIDEPYTTATISSSSSKMGESTMPRPPPIKNKPPKRGDADDSFRKGDVDHAQKKFGNAKAISSDQYFGNGPDSGEDYETKMNLSRFQGSSSISSADFFGAAAGPNSAQNRCQQRFSSSSSSTRALVADAMQNYDLDDVKESVRMGVTKVAGKLSSLANGVMSQLQDRYGGY